MQTKFMSIPSCLKRKSRAGFSIIEGIIALAIISIVIFATYSSYYKQESSAKRLARNNICELHNKKIFSLLSSKKLDDTVAEDFLSPEIMTGVLATNTAVFLIPASPTTAAALKSRFEDVLGPGDKDLYQKRPAETIETLNMKNNGTESRMPLLSNTHMGYLADLYNNGFKLVDGYKDLPLPLIPALEDPANGAAIGSLNQRYKTITKINLSLYRMADKVGVPDVVPYFPMPASQYPEKIGAGTAVTKFFPYSKNRVVMAQFPSWMREDLGIKVKLQTRVTDFTTNELIQDCENFSEFEYPNKLQNLTDFIDFDAFTYVGTGSATAFDPNQVKQTTTTKSSSKSQMGITDLDPLAPIFTNINIANPALGRDRNLCSQTGTVINNFYIKFRISNINKYPGTIPICIDTSAQWLAGEAARGWCPKSGYNYADRSHVEINYDWKPGDLGWVPCESLKFCGQAPDKVEVKKDSATNTLEYQYHYAIAADNNASRNRLWGCELKYMAATVDVAGNLSYPSNAKPNLGTDPAILNSFVSKLNPEPIKEINPKIYFKPPPCFLCACKPCKKKKGGFFGAIFAIILFIVLVIVTGGAAIFIASGYLTATLGVLAAMCGVGNLGCESSNLSMFSLSSPTGDQFTSCTDNFTSHCKCGTKCNKKRVPGPKWSDTLSGVIAPVLVNPVLCPLATLTRALGPQSTVVSMKLTYKTQVTAGEAATLLADTATYAPVLSSPNAFYVLRSIDVDGNWQPGVVENRDEVIWQEFDRSTGVYCVSRNTCSNGQWIQSRENYEKPDGTISGLVPVEGCFKVKTAHSIDWAQNLATYEMQDKPLPKIPICLEVDYPPGVFNLHGDTLKGYADLTHECADVKPENNTAPYPYPKPDFTNAKRRIVGTQQVGTCAAAVTYQSASGASVTVTPATAQGISNGVDSCYNNNSGGVIQKKNQLIKTGYLFNLLINKCQALPANYDASCFGFQCWTMCIPPTNLPVGPMNDQEQMYYENYTSGHRELQFCNGMDRNSFDIIK